MAAGLHEDGVRKGDVVCLFAPNVLEYPIALYAIATLGTLPSSLACRCAQQEHHGMVTKMVMT